MPKIQIFFSTEKWTILEHLSLSLLGNQKFSYKTNDFWIENDLILNKTLQNKLEKVQRAAMRVAIPWIPHTSACQIFEKVNMKPILDRAYDLTLKYLNKATVSNNIINENITQYSK